MDYDEIAIDMESDRLLHGEDDIAYCYERAVEMLIARIEKDDPVCAEELQLTHDKFWRMAKGAEI